MSRGRDDGSASPQSRDAWRTAAHARRRAGDTRRRSHSVRRYMGDRLAGSKGGLLRGDSRHTVLLVLREEGRGDLDEALNERERRVGDFSPAAVDHEGVSAVGHFDDLGDTNISLLAFERRVRDCPWHRVFLLAGDD